MAKTCDSCAMRAACAGSIEGGSVCKKYVKHPAYRKGGSCDLTQRQKVKLPRPHAHKGMKLMRRTGLPTYDGPQLVWQGAVHVNVGVAGIGLRVESVQDSPFTMLTVKEAKRLRDALNSAILIQETGALKGDKYGHRQVL